MEVCKSRETDRLLEFGYIYERITMFRLYKLS